MHPAATAWFSKRTSTWADWPLATIEALRTQSGTTVSVVLPARDEAASVGHVVERIRRDLVLDRQVVDEVVVMDSLSSDGTADAARDSGATVYDVAAVRPDLGVRAGKGEALWKSLFVTTGDISVFIDADLTEWGTHFVSGLLGPLLADPAVQLVRGFYDRLLDDGAGRTSTEGGRVTELLAKPLLASRWPELAAVVQPLAGEWAVRRRHFERLSVPTGYAVEFATLVDTAADPGLDAIAQVDLGSRSHRHQHVHDLGAMALEILTVADRRSFGDRGTVPDVIAQFDRTLATHWRERTVPVSERPPAVTAPGYPGPVVSC
ncbi:MAG: glucosyl-3-phosphoglycerate synthase [Jatrophihabitans sp.]